MKNKISKYVTRLIFIIVGCAYLSACSTHKSLPTLTVNYITSPQINLDINNVPSPVVVNVYELKNITAFKNTDYFTLTGDPKKVLGDDLIEQNQIELRPNQKTTATKNLNPETLYIAVTAAYRTIDKVQWHDFVTLRDNKSITIIVKLNKDGVLSRLQ